MIVLDTHIWIWLVHNDNKLPAKVKDYIYAQDTINLSIISCWEVSKLVEKNRLDLEYSLKDWLDIAVTFPKLELIELTTDIIADAAELPGDFHKDPGDQLITATARKYDATLVTMDKQILAYPHVKTY